MPKDVATVRSRKLLAKLELNELELILREIWLNYFGHVAHSSDAFSQFDQVIPQSQTADNPLAPRVTYNDACFRKMQFWSHCYSVVLYQTLFRLSVYKFIPYTSPVHKKYVFA